MQTQQIASQVHTSLPVEGSRIVNLHKLEQYINQLNAHANCKGEIKVTGELLQGLASVLYTECTSCGFKILLETSEKVQGPRKYLHWEANLTPVWGQMATGGGHAKL